MLLSMEKIKNRRRIPTTKALNIKHVAILHIDIVDSSQQVQRDMLRAHRQIQSLYKRLRSVCSIYGGIARELRGDAALFEFHNARDSIVAAGAIQQTIVLSNSTRMGYLNPQVRTGLSYGPVVHSDGMLTGEAVIRAQRIEQLAIPGQVLFDQFLAEQLVVSGFTMKPHSQQLLKGFKNSSVIHEALFDKTVSLMRRCA